jgi:hypothetical protein
MDRVSRGEGEDATCLKWSKVGGYSLRASFLGIGYRGNDDLVLAWDPTSAARPLSRESGSWSVWFSEIVP